MFYIAAIPTDENWPTEFYSHTERERGMFHSDYFPRFTPHSICAETYRTREMAESAIKYFAKYTDPYVWERFEVREA